MNAIRLTPSSKVIFLAIIASLNAVWGYPLVGLLASLLTLLILGAIANWLMRPRLSAVMQLPEVVVAHSIIDARISFENKGPMPTFDLALSLVSLPRQWIVSSRQQAVLQVSPHQVFDVAFSLQVAERGVYPWPAIRCESTFPFSLFRSRQDISFDQKLSSHINQIWVTPALVDSNVPQLVQEMLARGHTANGVRAGESQEYFGSREYCYGDFVRRWDFASWARLGRPIARQFDQGSTGNVTIVVDTFVETPVSAAENAKFENRLSLAASLIHSLRHTICQISLILPNSENVECVSAEHSMQEVLLRPLATATGIRPDSNFMELPSFKHQWAKVGSMIKPENTLICIMGSPRVDFSARSPSVMDNARRAFLTLVNEFPASLIISPEEPGIRRETHGAI